MMSYFILVNDSNDTGNPALTKGLRSEKFLSEGNTEQGVVIQIG
jgi:hypothetical protein